MDNNQPTESANSSFFDDANTDNYIFWKKKAPLKKHSEVKLMEGNLFRKSSKRANFWKSRYYILYEDRLAYHKNRRQAEDQEEHGYCFIHNVRIEAFVDFVESSNEKDKEKEKEERYRIRLTHNKQYFDLFARSKEIQEKWIHLLSKFCILTNYSSAFENIKAIGKGGFARVYLAKRKSDNAEFAVKTFQKDLLSSAEKAKVFFCFNL